MIRFEPIGTIASPWKTPEGMPIQSAAALGVPGEIILQPEYVEGLRDLDGFSHIILIYYFHKIQGYRLTVTPFLDNQPRGVFATRSPRRPNPIGLSVVKLLEINGRRLNIENIDILDGTPLLDIKPYAPLIDVHPSSSVGWLENKGFRETRSDTRFTGG